MTSAGWVLAGWGFVSGVGLTVTLVLPYIWRLKDRADGYTGPGAWRILARTVRAAFAAATRPGSGPVGVPVTPVPVGRVELARMPAYGAESPGAAAEGRLAGQRTMVLDGAVDRLGHAANLVDGLQRTGATVVLAPRGRPESLADVDPGPAGDGPAAVDRVSSAVVRGDQQLAVWPASQAAVLAADAAASFARRLLRLGGAQQYSARHAARQVRA
ncbi:hypothetical protein [Phytohabitans houttuyneae]